MGVRSTSRSEFLRAHPHVIREWVFESPSPIKWRGNSLDDSQVVLLVVMTVLGFRV